MAAVETPAATVEQSTSPTKTPVVKDAAVKETLSEAAEALGLLAQAKRNLLCGEVSQAVQQLQESCRKLASKYGETGDEVGESYLTYGAALLDLGRMESGVLGNALQGSHYNSEDEEEGESEEKASDDTEDEEKMTEEDKEKLSDEIIDAMTEDREPKKDETSEPKKDETSEPKKDETKTEESADVEMAESETTKTTEEEAKQNGEAEASGENKENVEVKENVKATENGEAVTGDVKENGEAVNGDVKENGEDEEAEKTEMETDGETKGEEVKDGAESEELDEGEEEVEGEEAEEGKTEEEGKDDPDEEDVSNLQLAWEVLELAKVIYSRSDAREGKLKAADCHLKLGEVGLETEQYEQAIEDFSRCLALQQQYLEPDSRLIAETHYQMGLACVLACRYDQALTNLRKAVSVINAKIGNLDKYIELGSARAREKGTFDPEVITAEKEVKDLRDILPDILNKIEDTEEEKKTQSKARAMVIDSLGAASGANVFSEGSSSTAFSKGTSSTAPTTTSAAPPTAAGDATVTPTDISHMVRKKRKTEEEPTVEVTEVKKPKFVEESKVAMETEVVVPSDDKTREVKEVNGGVEVTVNGDDKAVSS